MRGEKAIEEYVNSDSEVPPKLSKLSYQPRTSEGDLQEPVL